MPIVRFMKIPSWGLWALIILCYGPLAFSGEEAACRPTQENCDYYLCREKKKPCGPRGYLRKFGHFYCQKFLTHPADHFSPPGQKWLADVRLCLQEKLDKIPLMATCQGLKRRAISSHYGCYLNTGYCDLPCRDQKHLFKLVGRGVFNPLILLLGLRITKTCGRCSRPLRKSPEI